MWGLDHKEGWAPKKWCFWTVVLEKTLESPLDSMEIKAVSPNGNQPWIFIGRTDADDEAPIFWLPGAKGQLIGKAHDAEKDWGQEEKEWRRMKWLDCITDSMDMTLREFCEIVKGRGARHAAVQGAAESSKT